MTEEKRTNPNICPTHGNHFCWRRDDKIVCSVAGCNWSIPARRKEDAQIPLIKKDDAVVLKFTPGAYKCMHETIKKLKDFIYKLNPLFKRPLLEDIETVISIINSAEKAGKRGV